MPKWYRLNSSGSWIPTPSIYRLNASGAWGKLKTIYRLNASGSWGVVHSSQTAPTATTSPTLTNQVSSTTNFYGGDTLTLTRGAYTNTTSNSDTTYRMRIYKATNSSLTLNDTNWTVVSSANYTGANSNASTSLTYSLTDADAKAGYYLVGEVRVNNDANTAGSSSYDFETASRVLSRISFTVTNLAVTPTDKGGSFSWTVGGVADSTFIYSQTLTIRLTGPTGTIKNTVPIAPGTTTTTVTDPTNISPSTLYYAVIEVVANDGWKTTPTPNKLSDNEYFNTLSAAPVNTVAPTISPLNGRTPPSGYLGYLPVSTTLTSTTGTWTNLSSPTYTYNWYKEDSITGSLTPSLNAGSQLSYSVSDVDDFIFVQVRATNSDGSLGTANSGTYILHQAVAVGNVTPTTATQNVSTNFSFNISHYPTSYVVNWGDGTSNSYTVAANTSTVNQTIAKTYTTTGTKTITITAQPGNKTSTTNITVSAPAPSASGFSRSDATTTPSQPSTLSFSSSNNQVTTSWTNGTPVTSVQFQGSGAGVNTSYTDPSAPFITSDVSNYSSSGTYSATVTNYNNSLQVNVSWNQSNAQSYLVDYTSSVYGADIASGNNSTGSVSVNIPFSGGGTFTWTSLTLYTGLNQTGTSTQYSNPVAGGLVPTQKSSSRSGSVSLTYSLPKLATPTNVVASDNRTDGVNITWSAVSGAAYYGVWYGPPAPSYDSSPDFGGPSNPSLITGTSYLDTSITAGNSRDYYVQAFRTNNPANTKSDWSAGDSGTRVASVSPPVNTVAPSVTPSSGAAGTTFSSTNGTWTNSPTSYAYLWQYLEGSSWITTGQTNSTFNSTSWGGTSIRCRVTATNTGGSTQAFSNSATVTSGGGGSVPGIPTGVGLTGSGVVSWTASTGSPTSYEIEFYTAQSSAGASAAGPYTVTGISASPYQLVSPYASPNNWARVRVRARNSNGASAYSAWVPSATTYT